MKNIRSSLATGHRGANRAKVTAASSAADVPRSCGSRARYMVIQVPEERGSGSPRRKADQQSTDYESGGQEFESLRARHCARATFAHGEKFLEVAQLHEVALHAAEAMLLG